ncbi:MAG: hypothetical protein KAG97_07685, partial [Victivallales bacterium]|nr:hypothetical protein [Victivallales bacterium]
SSVAEGRSARSATSKFDLSHLDPKSIRCPDDMRDMVLKISSDYDERGGFFFDRHGDLVMVDLYGAGGVNNDVVKLLGLFPSLKMIRLGDTDVSDISPLEHCALDVLDLEKTDVEDLSPLKDMKTLKTLKLNDSNVKSLEPLRKLPLEMLDISGTNVSDLSPLAGMPLKGLRMVDCDVTKYSVLKGLRSLEALEPSGLWRKIPGKADNEGREQFFPKIHRLPPPKRRRRDDRRDFR